LHRLHPRLPAAPRGHDTATATITVVAQYHLGEADPGALVGNVADDPTVDSRGLLNLPRFGAPVYTAGGSVSSPSPLAVHFAGSPDRFGASTVLTSVTNNFGIEGWVKSDGNTSGVALLAYNGSSCCSGFGLYRNGASWGGLYGGITFVGASAPVTTSWTHLALVCNNGMTTFYVNGQPNANAAVTPHPASTNSNGAMRIGGNVNSQGQPYEFFDGAVDEVRVFTFAPGQFSPQDLEFFQNADHSIPTASLAGLSMLAALVLLGGIIVLRLRG